MLINNASQQRSKLYSWGHWFTVTNCFIGLLVSSIYWFSAPLPDTGLGLIYLFSYSIGHISFLFFIGYLLLVFPLSLLNKPQITKPWAALVASAGITLIFIDSLVYSTYNYHINLLSLDFIKNDFQLLTNNLPTGFKAALLIVFITIFVIQLVLANSVWRHIEQLRRVYLDLKVVPLMLASFVLGHLSHLWADATFYAPITQQDNLLPLSQPLTAKTILSQSGLIDLNAYNQKKQLSFNSNQFRLDMPKYNFNCFAPADDFQISAIALTSAEIDQLSAQLAHDYPQLVSSQHWSPVAIEQALGEIITGMPSIYQHQTQPYSSVLDTALLTTNVELNLQHWPRLGHKYSSLDRVSDQKLGFHFFHDSEQLIAQIQQSLTSKQIIVLLNKDKDHLGRLFMLGELVDLPKITSNFDLLPTIFEGWLSCSFYHNYAKFGQNLMSVTSEPAWLVTADQQHIYVYYNQATTYIDSNAQMKTLASQTQTQQEPPNNSILVRAIQHLKRYLIEK